MSEHYEVIVTSHGTGTNSSIRLLDPISGTILRSFKCENEIGANCLSFVGNDFLLYAAENKPFIYSSKINGEISKFPNSINVKGNVSALAVSPNSRYCVFAVGGSIKILNLDSGEITSTADRHFHSVKCIKFTDDGSCFVTAGLDGIIIVWNLAYTLSFVVREFFPMKNSRLMEPMHVFTSHSLPVTDLHVGHGGMQAFIVSVSGDQTCKIHYLADGNLIVSLVFKCALSAVTMSANESELFIGTIKGSIHKCNMNHLPRTRDYHMNKEDLTFVYQGHDKAISCLSTSLDGLHLLSASSDGRVILWDIRSGQSVKVLSHSHPVVNASFVICPKNTFLESFEPSSCSILRPEKEGSGLTFFYRKSGCHSYSEEGRSQLPNCEKAVPKIGEDEDIGSLLLGSNVEAHVKEFTRLRTLNKELFEFSLNQIMP